MSHDPCLRSTPPKPLQPKSNTPPNQPLSRLQRTRKTQLSTRVPAPKNTDAYSAPMPPATADARASDEQDNAGSTRDVSILLATAGSTMTALSRRLPPQRHQKRTSLSKVRTCRNHASCLMRVLVGPHTSIPLLVPQSFPPERPDPRRMKQ